MLLALDTSTPTVTVAVHDGSTLRAEAQGPEDQRHTESLAPAIAAALRAAGIDRRELTRIAVGVGPGPFTGLRVGLVTARTLGFALDIEVIGVCSLDITAQQVMQHVVEQGARPDSFLVAHDARRREVYWARYEDGRRLGEPAVGPASGLPAGLPAAGAGAALYPEAFAAVLEPMTPSAAALAQAVVDDVVERFPPDPMYLRRPDATPPGERKSVLT